MTAPNEPTDHDLPEQPFVSHLVELRDRLKRALIAVGLVFLCLFPFANELYQWISRPLLEKLPQGHEMIATGVISPFLAPFKLSLVVAIFIAMPYLLYQMWMFVAPGLYKREKKVLMPIVGSSALLFYCGALFAYYIVFPLVFVFMVATTPEGVNMAPDITQYLEFVLTLFFAFGLAFEVPIATVILVWIGATTPQKLAEKRPYIVVGAFCLGMLLTPPDVISQTLLALPMWLLFECGVFFSRIIQRDRDRREQSDGAVGQDQNGSDTVEDVSGSAVDAEEVVDFKGGGTKGTEADDLERYTPISGQELNEQLGIESTDAGEHEQTQKGDPIEDKLFLIQQYRDQGEVTAARGLLYEVLAEGNEDQKMVAQNILAQLDEA